MRVARHLKALLSSIFPHYTLLSLQQQRPYSHAMTQWRISRNTVQLFKKCVNQLEKSETKSIKGKWSYYVLTKSHIQWPESFLSLEAKCKQNKEVSNSSVKICNLQ